MNETGTAARAWMNPTESEQRAETQIRRPSLRLIFGLEKTATTQSRAWWVCPLIGCRSRKRAVREQRNSVQAIETQRGGSANHETNLADGQRLILNCHGEHAVKEGFDKIFTQDGIPLNSQCMPGGRFRR